MFTRIQFTEVNSKHYFRFMTIQVANYKAYLITVVTKGSLWNAITPTFPLSKYDSCCVCPNTFMQDGQSCCIKRQIV